MKFIWTMTAFGAATVMAMPHGAHETREPSVYVRGSEATEEVKDEDTYLKGKATHCLPSISYHHLTGWA
ncbi:hypothetical protein E5D57_002542 [Metarhizium anisopliae]|nr:hypothetical protein E5D57_002542 [Metarhizium anisopliae]